jgi:hypothetical protein
VLDRWRCHGELILKAFGEILDGLYVWIFRASFLSKHDTSFSHLPLSISVYRKYSYLLATRTSSAEKNAWSDETPRSYMLLAGNPGMRDPMTADHSRTIKRTKTGI